MNRKNDPQPWSQNQIALGVSVCIVLALVLQVITR